MNDEGFGYVDRGGELWEHSDEDDEEEGGKKKKKKKLNVSKQYFLHIK